LTRVAGTGSFSRLTVLSDTVATSRTKQRPASHTASGARRPRCCSWCIERDVPLIAKSAHRDRIAENAQIFDFTLSNADMADLDALDRTGGTQRALERKWW
jgi:diketogulonate reductase-like aldo/keto reductase